MGPRAFTIVERPDLREAADHLSSVAWPEFLLHDTTTSHHWNTLWDAFAAFQLVICEEGEVVAVGNTIPVYWDGALKNLPGGLDDVLERGMADREARSPNVLSALAAIVSPEHRGRDLGTTVLRAMKDLTGEHGMECLIAPVRPSLKHAYPLPSMEEYIGWKRPDGSRLDPWMRAHDRLGAQILRVAPNSMSVSGTVEQWRSWTGLELQASGEYVVPGALSPVSVDLEKDLATYQEPNVWMCHPV